MPSFSFEKISTVRRSAPLTVKRGVIVQMLDKIAQRRLDREALTISHTEHDLVRIKAQRKGSA